MRLCNPNPNPNPNSQPPTHLAQPTAYLANEIKRAYAGSGKNDSPGLEKATGYTGKANRNEGQRSD